MLDLESLRLRRLAERPDISPKVTSPDARRVVLGDEHGEALWAEIR